MISENIVKTEIINCLSCEKTYNDDLQEITRKEITCEECYQSGIL